MTQCHDTMSPYTAVILSGYFVILSGVGGGNKESFCILQTINNNLFTSKSKKMNTKELIMTAVAVAVGVILAAIISKKLKIDNWEED